MGPLEDDKHLGVGRSIRPDRVCPRDMAAKKTRCTLRAGIEKKGDVMGLNTFASNLMSVHSDCPHRERFGYGGDALAAAETVQSYWDMGAFYAKRLVDYSDAQRNASGAFTETAPFVGIA